MPVLALSTGALILSRLGLIKKFLGANKWVVIAIALAGTAAFGYWQFDKWRDNLIEVSEQAGFEKAEDQYTAAINAANAKVDEKNELLAGYGVAFNLLSEQKAQSINVKFDPIIRNIQDEIAKDPIYRECVISDSMRESLNSGRSTVNEAISSSDPVRAGQEPEPVEAAPVG